MAPTPRFEPLATSKHTDYLREFAFQAVVNLAARYGGAEATLGGAGLRARAARVWERSLVGHAFPSLWLEVPLLGEPGFDLHVYYDRGQVAAGERFSAECGFGCQALFDWFFAQEAGGVGVGLAHDLRGGSVRTGAYVNFNGRALADPSGFFASLGAQWAAQGMEVLLARLPNGWNPWYMGLFPGRMHGPARLGSFVRKDAQNSYAADSNKLGADLCHLGLNVEEAPLASMARLAALPFKLELQLDLMPDGSVGSALGVDLTIGERSPARCRALFAPGGSGAQACELLEQWGMADGRWRALAGSWASRLVPFPADGSSKVGIATTCWPSFVKAKWNAGVSQPAKVYLHCTTMPVRIL